VGYNTVHCVQDRYSNIRGVQVVRFCTIEYIAFVNTRRTFLSRVPRVFVQLWDALNDGKFKLLKLFSIKIYLYSKLNLKLLNLFPI